MARDFFHRLARAGVAFGGYGAGVDDINISPLLRADDGKPFLLQQCLHFGGVVLVGPATEGCEGDFHDKFSFFPGDQYLISHLMPSLCFLSTVNYFKSGGPQAVLDLPHRVC